MPGFPTAPGQRTLTRTPAAAASIRKDVDKADDRVLCGAIADDERRRPQARARSHIHDVPEPLPEHDRIGGLHAMHDAVQVDVQDAIPVIEFVVPSLSHNANPRDVEQVVQASGALNVL